MNAPAILLVTDRDGVRGFVDVSADAWTPDRPETLIQLSDGGRVRVPTSLLTALDEVNYFVSCSLAELVEPGTSTATMMTTAEVVVRTDTVATVPVVAESLHVHKEVHETGSVRVSKQVHVRDEQVEIPLVSEDFEITRVPVNRVVEAPVPVRQEGDTTIYSVLEEVLVVEKRLVVREELHLRARRSQRVETQTVQLRAEEVTVERTTAPKFAPPPPPPPIKRGETP